MPAPDADADWLRAVRAFLAGTGGAPDLGPKEASPFSPLWPGEAPDDLPGPSPSLGGPLALLLGDYDSNDRAFAGAPPPPAE